MSLCVLCACMCDYCIWFHPPLLYLLVTEINSLTPAETFSYCCKRHFAAPLYEFCIIAIGMKAEHGVKYQEGFTHVCPCIPLGVRMRHRHKERQQVQVPQ